MFRICPTASVPVGKTADDNIEVRQWTPEGFSFDKDGKTLDHIELGKKLKILDFERGAKISGSGFPLYLGKGATLERALINFMLDYHLQNHNYTEVFPPFLVNRDSMKGTGQLPKMEDDMYAIDKDELYPIPTAEVPITNIYRNEIINESELPIRHVGYSACFRREAGSYGKESKGFLRVHQFNKVEMVKLVRPETSYDELEDSRERCRRYFESVKNSIQNFIIMYGRFKFFGSKVLRYRNLVACRKPLA